MKFVEERYIKDKKYKLSFLILGKIFMKRLV